MSSSLTPPNPPTGVPLGRTVMLMEENPELVSLYTAALRASGWQVVGNPVSPLDFLPLYLGFDIPPQFLLVEYSDAVIHALTQILHLNPSQYMIFVTADSRLLMEPEFLPSSLRHVPVILKSTHTIDEMVADLEELNYYYPS